MGKQRFICGRRCEEGGNRRQQQDAPAAKRQPDQESKAEENAGKAHEHQT
jgi:hypothetical protein